MCQLPEKACVRCQVLLRLLSADSAQVDCTQPCEGHEGGSDASADEELDFAAEHMRVCLLERMAQPKTQNSMTTEVCTESISLHRGPPSTALGPAYSATLRLRVLNNSYFRQLLLPEQRCARACECGCHAPC